MRNVSWSMLRQPSRNSAPSCITRFGKEMQPWKRHASRRRQNLRLSAACLKPKRLVIVAIGCCEQALATNRDLQAKLDAFARGFETAKAEPAAERQARLKADDSRQEAPLVTAREAVLPASHDDAVIQTIRRPVGRPRKTAATAPARQQPKGRPWILMRSSPRRQAISKRRPETERPPDKNRFSGGLRAGTAAGHRRPVWGKP